MTNREKLRIIGKRDIRAIVRAGANLHRMEKRAQNRLVKAGMHPDAASDFLVEQLRYGLVAKP